MITSVQSAAIKSIPPIVMVVNDHSDTVALYERMLSSAGMWVAAGSGREAFDYALELCPDAIVSDMDVRPGTEGREFLRRLRAEPRLRDVPVVLLTSFEPEAGSALDVQAVMIKPVEQPALLANVKSVLERSHALQVRSTTLRRSVAGVIGRAQQAVARSERLRQDSPAPRSHRR